MAPNGTTVTLTITGTGARSFSNSSSALSTTCSTSGGACTAQIYSGTPGVNTISATTTFSVSGVSLTRSTGDGISSDSGPVVKPWVDAYIKFPPKNTPAEVNPFLINDTATTATCALSLPDALPISMAPNGTTV